jgi:hypothetical protein
LDPTAGLFGYLYGVKMIHGKGRDIKIGPEAPQEGPYGYGSQWKLIHDGSVDFPLYGVYNIGKIQTAKVKIVHYPDETTDKALIDLDEIVYESHKITDFCYQFLQIKFTPFITARRLL